PCRHERFCREIRRRKPGDDFTGVQRNSLVPRHGHGPGGHIHRLPEHHPVPAEPGFLIIHTRQSNVVKQIGDSPMITRKKLASMIGAAVLGVAASQPALADTFRFAVGFPAGAPVEAAKKYAEAVQEYTSKKHRVRIFELSLLNHSEMSEGINKGLADVGYLLTAYSPSDYPFSNR